jgi:hypothetical protein
MGGVHLWVGGLGVLVFLITGQFMRHHQPPMGDLSEAARLMLRSRHIYILASGLVNLMLGLYMRRQAGGWQRVIQAFGSGLLIGSTALLIVAFIVEPGKGFQVEMAWSAAGLYALFGGSMAHLASSFGQPDRSGDHAAVRLKPEKQ